MGAASVPAQNRQTAADSPREAGAAARLELAEVLVAGDEAAECAQATVAWLGEHAGARRAICALIDAESGRVERVAAHGVPRTQVESLSLVKGVGG